MSAHFLSVIEIARPVNALRERRGNFGEALLVPNQGQQDLRVDVESDGADIELQEILAPVEAKDRTHRRHVRSENGRVDHGGHSAHEIRYEGISLAYPANLGEPLTTSTSP